MATTLSLAPLFRHSVGFDRFNDLFESALRSEAGTTYPPHNVEKHGDDHYRIVIAAAGLVEDDLDIQVEKGVLTVAGGKREHDENITYLHQGIAQRAFRLSFRLVDHIFIMAEGGPDNASSLLLFYIFFEFTLIPLFFLIGIWGSEQRRHAAIKFFLFTLAGSLLTFLSLLAIVVLNYGNTGVLTFSIPESSGRRWCSISQMDSFRS